MIADRIVQIKERLAQAALRGGHDPKRLRLVAVSKRHPASAIEEAMAAGQHDFGENFVQELVEKRAALPQLSWHYIGRLQRNKVKFLAGQVALIHSIDSLALLEELQKRCEKNQTHQSVLLQVNVAGEEQKGGIVPAELCSLLGDARQLDRVEVRGLMTMPPHVESAEDNRPHFARLAQLAKEHGLAELSVGMSNDGEVAAEEGATLVRVGTAIFGARPT